MATVGVNGLKSGLTSIEIMTIDTPIFDAGVFVHKEEIITGGRPVSGCVGTRRSC